MTKAKDTPDGNIRKLMDDIDKMRRDVVAAAREVPEPPLMEGALLPPFFDMCAWWCLDRDGQKWLWHRAPEPGRAPGHWLSFGGRDEWRARLAARIVELEAALKDERELWREYANLLTGNLERLVSITAAHGDWIPSGDLARGIALRNALGIKPAEDGHADVAHGREEGR